MNLKINEIFNTKSNTNKLEYIEATIEFECCNLINIGTCLFVQSGISIAWYYENIIKLKPSKMFWLMLIDCSFQIYIFGDSDPDYILVSIHKDGKVNIERILLIDFINILSVLVNSISNLIADGYKFDDEKNYKHYLDSKKKVETLNK